MSAEETVLVIGAALAVVSLIAAAVLLRPKGREALYVALPLVGAVVLAVLVWGRV